MPDLDMQYVRARRRFFSRNVPVGSDWRHLKTGGVYRVKCVSIRESDGAILITYQSNVEDIWTREAAEFIDGRFERCA